MTTHSAIAGGAAAASGQPDAALAVWRLHEERLLGMAYRMLGSMSDAEDVLQEAFLRLRTVDVAELRDPRAWLTTVVSRLCLTQLTSARARRETYVGPWLPEPTDRVSDPADDVLLSESITAAFLLVLEALSPVERIAFVLHDVFGHPFADIAVVLDRDEAACRQLASRARRAVAARRPRFSSDARQRHAATERFLEACAGRDLAALLEVLAPDVELRTDGGGRARAARRIVRGEDRVARFLLGVLAKRRGREAALPSVHGSTAMAWYDEQGTLVGVLSTSIDGTGRVARVNVVLNADKLRHVGDGPAYGSHSEVPSAPSSASGP